ncbi:hypothetical protein AB1N83_013134, partial [Pleurotus pulmonarius]
TLTSSPTRQGSLPTIPSHVIRSQANSLWSTQALMQGYMNSRPWRLRPSKA